MIEEWEFDDLQTDIRYFTKRDLSILKDLYDYRTLTTQQVLRWYFDKKRYGYQRMYLMRKDALITSRPLIIGNGRKQTSCYFITDKGIRILLREGFIKKPVRQARNMQVKGAHLRYVVESNEIYLQLRGYGWKVLGGREVKQAYKLNRANLIQGMLISESGEKYGVYLIADDPSEQTVVRIMTEIGRGKLPSYIVFCRGITGYKLAKEQAMELNTFVGGSLNLLPFSNGVKILQSLRSEDRLVKLYTKYGSGVTRDEQGKRFSHLIYHKGEEKYVAQLLTGDLMTRFQLSRYHRDDYAREGRKVLVFAWAAQRGEIEQAYQAYPHIEFEWLRMEVLETLSD